MVGVSASVNLSLHRKVQKFSSGTSSPRWSRKKGRKTVVVVVELLHQISQYFVIYFSRITIQRICGRKDSCSCQIQVECSSLQHFNTHAVRAPRVLTFETSFCTQCLITFQNVSIMLTSSYYAGKRYLKIEIPCSFFNCKEWCTGAVSS